MDYATPSECIRAIQSLNPSHALETHSALLNILAALRQHAASREQSILALETARPIADQAQTILTRHYTAQSPVPNSPADDILKRVVKLWQIFAQSYDLIIRTIHDIKKVQKDELALLMQRRMYYDAQAMIAYFHAHRALPPGSWAGIHSGYREALTCEVLHIRVSDPLNSVWKAQSTQEAHTAVLLADLANPYSRTAKELRMITGWAQRFAPYCRLDDEIDNQRPSTYVLDLAQDSSLRPLGLVSPQQPTLKRFDSSVFAEQLETVITQLKQGIQPVALGLGRDCSADTCYRLLLSLYRPWCLASAGRRFPRHTNRGDAILSRDWKGIGFHLTGEIFQQPTPYARRPTSQHDVATHDVHIIPDDLLPEETWQILDQSANGFRLQKEGASTAFEHNTLISLQTHDNPAIQLGYISRLLYLYDGRLEAGIQLLSGKPTCVGVRIAAKPEQSNTLFEEGFLLPVVEAMKIPASLVIPINWFAPSRIIDLYYNGQISTIRLHQRLMRGNNFDQVSFEVVERAKTLSVLEENVH